MAENSDNEDALILDEEDLSFLQQDMQDGVSEVIIESAGRSVSNQYPGPAAGEVVIESADPSDYTAGPTLLDTSFRGMVPEFVWKKNCYNPYNFSETNYEFGKINILQESDSINPIDIFEMVTNFRSLIEKIIMPETLRFANENGAVFTTDLQELAAFIGMNYVMGYHVLPSLRNYWSTEPDMGVPYIASVMPLARFEEIRRNFHFCNNASQPSPTSPI